MQQCPWEAATPNAPSRLKPEPPCESCSMIDREERKKADAEVVSVEGSSVFHRKQPPFAGDTPEALQSPVMKHQT